MYRASTGGCQQGTTLIFMQQSRYRHAVKFIQRIRPKTGCCLRFFRYRQHLQQQWVLAVSLAHTLYKTTGYPQREFVVQGPGFQLSRVNLQDPEQFIRGIYRLCQQGLPPGPLFRALYSGYHSGRFSTDSVTQG
jgi:hypothetical protein